MVTNAHSIAIKSNVSRSLIPFHNSNFQFSNAPELFSINSIFFCFFEFHPIHFDSKSTYSFYLFALLHWLLGRRKRIEIPVDQTSNLFVTSTKVSSCMNRLCWCVLYVYRDVWSISLDYNCLILQRQPNWLRIRITFIFIYPMVFLYSKLRLQKGIQTKVNKEITDRNGCVNCGRYTV